MMDHPEYRDEARVAHMGVYLSRIASIMQNLVQERFRDGEPETERILYNLMILGEAANNVSREFASAHPEVDFKDIAGLRHKLVHDYANIDLSRIWSILETDVPRWNVAVANLCKTLPPAPSPPENLYEFL